MLYRVARTVTEKPIEDQPAQSRSIADYRDHAAYVLLGEPGAGKSTLFEDEAKRTDNAICISARDFIALDNDQWQQKTLFIDGLDEARAGKDDARTPLDAIRNQLNKLGCRKFRISCREADWLANLDNRDLAKVSPSNEITQLYLQPLTHDDIKTILDNDDRVTDAANFIERAEHSGLAGLLTNPQTLDMLINAVKGGKQWPYTKHELYQLASEQLAIEFNDDHQAAEKSPFNTPALLDAAGLLCALQLLANLSGFTEGYAQAGRISLNDFKPLPASHSALKTRLFRKTGDEYSYVHRSIAEYLAACYIAERIKQGLSIYRVLAITTGVDGGIVAALRGLMAWLAVLSEPARERFIDIDPLGLVVYGDVQLFPKASKSRLLNALSREAQTTGFPVRDWHTTAFSALCSHDVANELVQILNNTGYSDGEQYLLYCLLNGLGITQERIVEIKPALMQVIRDHSHEIGIRSNALGAFMHQYPEDIDSLLELAADINSGKIEDSRSDLLEELLATLVPINIKPVDAIKFLKVTNNGDDICCFNFWSYEFEKKLSHEELPAILDAFYAAGFSRLSAMLENLFDLVGGLLVLGLNFHGQAISDERLYQWLSIDLDEYDAHHFNNEDHQKIAQWLQENPIRYFGLISVGLSKIDRQKPIYGEVFKIFSRLRDVEPPENSGVWWLSRIRPETDSELKNLYFQQAFASRYKKNGGLSLDYLSDWVKSNSEFEEQYKNLIFMPFPEWWYKRQEAKEKRKSTQEQKLNEKLDYLHKNQQAISEGNASPHVFYQLATAFDHRVTISGKTAEQRLAEFLNNDEALIAAAKSGLQKIAFRNDIPTAKEILALDTKGEYHFIRRPFLVCIDLLYRENSNILAILNGDLLHSALAFCFTEGAFRDDWLKSLCIQKTDTVSQAYFEYITTLLAAKAEYIHGIHYLTYTPECKQIANNIVLPVLEKYPVRGYKNHINHLAYLLKAAILNADKAMLSTLIEKKLACIGMDVAQRVYWLATGLIVNPRTYEMTFKHYIGSNSDRINHVSAFLLPMHGNEPYFTLEQVSTITMLIALFAPRCQPNWPLGGGLVTRAMEERDYVRYLLNNLAESPSQEATQALADLLEESKLLAWHEKIREAQQTQQINRREALFKHPDAQQVLHTLNNQKPANVADLAVLTRDCLQQLADGMHTSDTDSYKNFWNLDGKNPKQPRYEEICRNHLADRLKPMLAKYDVAVEPEALQAELKRVDIKLSFNRDGKAYYLPIEIKCDYNRDLWKTIHQQLIPQYTVSPETEGRGLYLVLWFNHKRLPTHPQGLLPPQSPCQLAEMLTATMTPQERKFIDVFVLDVSANKT